MEAAVLVSHSAFGKLECDFGAAAELETQVMDSTFPMTLDHGCDVSGVELSTNGGNNFIPSNDNGHYNARTKNQSLPR